MHTWDQLRLQYSGPTFRTNKRLSFSCEASHISTLKNSNKKWTLMHMVNCLMHSAVQQAEKAIFLWLIFDLSFSLSKKKLRQGWQHGSVIGCWSHHTRASVRKNSLLIRVNIFLNLHQKCSYSNLPIIPTVRLHSYVLKHTVGIIGRRYLWYCPKTGWQERQNYL